MSTCNKKKRRLTEVDNNGVLSCPKCEFSCQNRDDLKRHEDSAHAKKAKIVDDAETEIVYECGNCDEVFRSKKSLKRHVKNVHLFNRDDEESSKSKEVHENDESRDENYRVIILILTFS